MLCKGAKNMGRRRSDGWSKRVGTGVRPPPSFLERHWVLGLALALTVALVLLGLTILASVEHWFG
jgi:hypothetical protein